MRAVTFCVVDLQLTDGSAASMTADLAVAFHVRQCSHRFGASIRCARLRSARPYDVVEAIHRGMATLADLERFEAAALRHDRPAAFVRGASRT